MYALIGYGKMGRMIESIARDNIVSVIDPTISSGDISHKSISKKSMKGVNVAIDFTAPQAVVGNIEQASQLGVNMVVGTTGWYSELERVRKIVEKNNIGLIYAPNFSVGVQVFYRIVRNAARMFNRLGNEYDPFLVDFHHTQKIDSSGTGGQIANVLLEELDSKGSVNRDERQRQPNEIDAKGVRAGAIPGTHMVGFDSEADTIKMEHVARSRLGFARGAIMAAEWIQGKQGLFTIDDMMNDIMR